MTKLYRVLGVVSLACGVIACFLLFKTQPLHGMLYGVLGIALGLALYEIGELRERVDHVEDVLSISAEKEALREEEKAAEKMAVSAHRK